MQHRKAKLGLAAAGALALSVGVGLTPAMADYAPANGDAVGVGSDTLQYAGDFMADGDYLGDAGYNALGLRYKMVNFDATPDANARLAYGSGGASGPCGPGTGTAAGTGNATTTNTSTPCVLNPTIVERAGTKPVQRPNGSGAGAKALAGDTANGTHYLTYSRASACQGPTTGCSGTLSNSYDSVTIGTDPLAMLEAKTSNAVPLSEAQLNAIYSCQDTTWTQVGGSSSATIIPIVPQAGSGTRSSFLSAIGNPTLGSCVKTSEENDPTAIAAQSSPADAIEPMSGARLDLFLGQLGTGGSNGQGSYFQDPSCGPAAAGTPTTGNCAAANNQIAPQVKLVTSGTPSDSGALFKINRPLYIYFRDSDVNSKTPWQPGGTLNAVRTLFYNPCPDATPTSTDGCTTVNGTTYGPGGPPFLATPAGQALVSASGISPGYTPTVGGP